MFPSAHDDTVLRRSFVSVHGQYELVGAAVLIADSVVLTCAHVVNSALGRDHFDASLPPTGNVVRLRMPHVARDQELLARVDHAMWRPPRAFASRHSDAAVAAGSFPYFGDLAVLRLAEPAPGGAEPAPFLPERDGQDVIALWASGNTATTVRALPRAVAGPWIVLDVAAGEVHPGFSGGPLWDRSREAVVGIVVATHLEAPGTTSGAARSLYGIGLPTIEAELPDLPPVQVPTAELGRQRMLHALERLLPGTEAVVKCEERLSAKLHRTSAHRASNHHNLLALTRGVRRGVPELLATVREYLVDNGVFRASSEAWNGVLHAARILSPSETLTAQQRRDLVGLLGPDPL